MRDGELALDDGTSAPFDACLWCTQASPAAWVARTGLPTGAHHDVCLAMVSAGMNACCLRAAFLYVPGRSLLYMGRLTTDAPSLTFT